MERGGNYVLDSRLEHRIRSYLEANKSNKYVDVVEMADSLRNLYPEYGRKKRIPFRISVEKTFENIQSSMGVEDTEVINDDNFSESDADITELDPLASTEKQGGNQLMRSMYNKNNSKPSSSDNANDDIFIIDTIGGNSPEDLEAESLPSVKTGKQPAKTAASRKNKKRKRTSDSDVDDEPMKDSKRPESHLQKATATFADVGGNRKTLEEVCWLLLHLKHPEIYNKLGICPPRGILLHGPPGSGKTLLANAIAGELDFPLCKVSAPEIVSGVSGESEEKIRTLFEEAITNAPCVLFLDEIDAITPKRETAQREMERRIVAQLLSCMDDLGSRPLTASVLVIGATNRPDALDPALRRAGRFDREIALGIPDQAARIHVLQVLTRNLALGKDIDWTYLGKRTPGFVGADLAALTREAAMASVNKEMLTLRDKFVASKEAPEPEKSQPLQIESSEQPELHATTSFKVESTGEAAPAPSKQSMTLENLTSWLKEQTSYQPEQLQHLTIGMEDFVDALRVVQPSALREGFATVPDVTWDDVGALKSVREELEMAILAPVRHAEAFAALGVNSPSGVLLCGPPGCGKTLLAKAVANEAGINFISVKGPELLNMYVGESERAVRQCFQRARNSAPCVIFFDELDALCPKRSDHGEGGSSVRVVNQLLTEMDGLEARKGVYLMAATNRPDIIDPAVLRPGRLDKILYVGLPTVEDRLDILKAVTKNGTRPRLAPDVDFAAITSHPKSENLTGADVAALVREAAVLALKELVFSSKMEDPASLAVHARHFQEALEKIKPSVSEKDLIKYERQRR